jgi:hypothetical protein
MVIHNLNVPRTARRPDKANAKLVVDADAVLSPAIALQRFQAISRWHLQIVKLLCAVQHRQFSHRHRLDIREALDTFALKKSFRVGALERDNCHSKIVTFHISIVEQYAVFMAPREILLGTSNEAAAYRSPDLSLSYLSAISNEIRLT